MLKHQRHQSIATTTTIFNKNEKTAGMISVTNSRNICCHTGRALRALAPSSEPATPILVPAPSLPQDFYPLCLTFFSPIPPINQFDCPGFGVTPSRVSSNMHLIYSSTWPCSVFFFAYPRNFSLFSFHPRSTSTQYP